MAALSGTRLLEYLRKGMVGDRRLSMGADGAVRLTSLAGQIIDDTIAVYIEPAARGYVVSDRGETAAKLSYGVDEMAVDDDLSVNVVDGTIRTTCPDPMGIHDAASRVSTAAFRMISRDRRGERR